VYRWAADGGKNIFGEEVVFFELLMDIVERLEDMGNGKGEEGGMDILFWRVTKEENQEAGELVADAFAQSWIGSFGTWWKICFESRYAVYLAGVHVVVMMIRYGNCYTGHHFILAFYTNNRAVLKSAVLIV
jgi:hypothetical protein